MGVWGANQILLVQVDLDDPAEDLGLAGVGPDHREYGRWLAVAEDGEDRRPEQRG